MLLYMRDPQHSQILSCLDVLVDDDLAITLLWVILNNGMGIDESLEGIGNLQESIIPDIIFRLSVNG